MPQSGPPNDGQEPNHPVKEWLKKYVVQGAGGLALGTGTGLGAAYLADQLYDKIHKTDTGVPYGWVKPAIGVTAGAGALLHQYILYRQAEEMKDAIEKYRNHNSSEE